MSPEQEAKIRGYATAPYGVPGLVALAQVVLEHEKRLDLLASLLDRDGGADPIGRCAEPTSCASSIFDHATAAATAPALTNDGTIDVRAIAGEANVPHRYSNTTFPEFVVGLARKSTIIGSHSRPRVRDDLAEIVRNPGSSVLVVDRILDRLVDATYGTPACERLLAIKAGQ